MVRVRVGNTHTLVLCILVQVYNSTCACALCLKPRINATHTILTYRHLARNNNNQYLLDLPTILAVLYVVLLLFLRRYRRPVKFVMTASPTD